MNHLPLPPALPGLTWRPLAEGDGPALAVLAAACASCDSNPCPPDAASCTARLAAAAAGGDASALAAATLAMTGPDDVLLAYAWFTGDGHLAHEYRAFLEGGVHPAWRGRGLGGFLLTWLEAAARAAAAGEAAGRPITLRIDTYDTTNLAATRLYGRHGFTLALAEDDMRRALPAPPSPPSPLLPSPASEVAPGDEVASSPSPLFPFPASGKEIAPLPPVRLPPGASLATWTPETIPAFFAVYQAAFRDRPGFPGWRQDEWQAAFAGGPGFRAGLSRLLYVEDVPAGYTLCAVETDEGAGEVWEGWILQMGVHPAWRRRGLAAGLLVQALHDFAAEGLPAAMLSVNPNNPAAAALYRRMGFVTVRRLSSYRKPG